MGHPVPPERASDASALKRDVPAAGARRFKPKAERIVHAGAPDGASVARPVVLAAWEPLEPEEALAVHEMLGRRAELHWSHELTPDLRRELLPRADVLMVMGWPDWLDPSELRRMRRLRFIQRLPAGVESVPFAALRGRRPRVLVASGSGSNAQAVAEHAWALVLACAKRVARHDAALRRGEFHQLDWSSRELAGATLGLVGYGEIGRRVARLGRAFGMRVVALRRRPPYRRPVVGGPRALEFVLRQSDVVVLAVPLTRTTQGWIGAKELAFMKTDGILVNVARGGVLDEAALYAHLARHPDFSAGLDVWWHYPKKGEPFRQEHPFENLPNVVLTPHVAAITPAWRTRLARFGAHNVARFLAGRAPQNVAEPGDYA